MKTLLLSWTLLFSAAAFTPSLQAKPAPRPTQARPPKAGKTSAVFLYIANAAVGGSDSTGSTVARYSADTNGSLTFRDTFSLPPTSNAMYGAMDPAGRFFYVAQPLNGDIVCYHTNGSGKLTLAGSAAIHLDGHPLGISFDPTGRFVYIDDYRRRYRNTSGESVTPHLGDEQVSRIWQYRIAADGNLTPLTPAYTLTEGIRPQPLCFTRDGRFAYLAYQGGVSGYRVDADGTLAFLPAASSHELYSRYFALDPKGRFAYVAASQQSQRVRRYAVGEDGSLTALADIPVPAKCSGEDIHLDPAGQHVYIGTYNSEAESIPGRQYPLYHQYLYQYRVQPDGTFVPLNPPRVDTVVMPVSFGFDPAGRFLYFAGPADKVYQLPIRPDGTLGDSTPANAAMPISSEHRLTVVRRPAD